MMFIITLRCMDGKRRQIEPINIVVEIIEKKKIV
jgi:hypothetical protein